MSDRVSSTCDQCGQTDDHPKVHMQGLVDGVPGIISKHHDCLSVHEERAVVASGQAPGTPKASAIIRECKAGLRGDDLLEFITGTHKKADLAVGQAHADQLKRETLSMEQALARYDRLIADADARIVAGDPFGDAQALRDWAAGQRDQLAGRAEQ